MNIREYTSADYDRLVQMMTDFKNDETVYNIDSHCIGLDSESAKKFTDVSLAEIQKKEGGMFLAEVDDAVAGFVMTVVDNFEDFDGYAQNCYKPHRVGHIAIIFVDAKYRRKGVATKLIEYGKARLVTQDCAVLKLNVKAGNPAEKLYEKVGFRVYNKDMLIEV